MTVTAFRCVVAAALLASNLGCSKPFVPAERCHLVDVKPEDGAAVFSLLDEFATTNGFSSRWKDAQSRLFTYSSKGREVSSIHYRAGTHEQGAELAYFQFDETFDGSLSAAFDRFVADKLATRFSVTKCSDVPGYAPPSML